MAPEPAGWCPGPTPPRLQMGWNPDPGGAPGVAEGPQGGSWAPPYQTLSHSEAGRARCPVFSFLLATRMAARRALAISEARAVSSRSLSTMSQEQKGRWNATRREKRQRRARRHSRTPELRCVSAFVRP